VILPSGEVQLPLINVYSPPRLDSYRNELILVVLNHDGTGLFMNELDEVHPLTIQDGLDNIMT